MVAKITSPLLKYAGKAGLPKYVFVLSLENRSFDHLFGRSGITGKDAVTKAAGKALNGVLDGSGNIDPKYSNVFDGKTFTIPNTDAPWVMPSDPKHEFEHILCQVCGPAACRTLFSDFNAGPDSMGTGRPDAAFLDKVPPPPQCSPQWIRYSEKVSPGQGALLKPDRVSARPAPDNSGFVHSYARSFTVNSKENGGDVPDGAAPCPDPGLVMACFNTPTQLPILHQLASNFVICDNFFASLPGPTGPNRFFMMAGSSAGYDGGPAASDTISWTAGGHLPATKGNIFTRLDAAGVKFQIYGDDNFPMAGVMQGVHPTNTFNVRGGMAPLEGELKKASDKKPFPYNFVWIEPDYDVASSGKGHPMYARGNSMHPCSDVRRAEELVADIYNWIAGNEHVWQNCVLFITWDEHGAFYDHVPSPPATPPSDAPVGRTWQFKFDRLGTRVPCLVISPFIESNLIDSRQYDHTSILKTVIDLHNKGAFNSGKAPSKTMQPWTERIAAAASMVDLFTQDAAKAGKVSLGTPLTPDPFPDFPDLGPRGKPSGNELLVLASAFNLAREASPSLSASDFQAALASSDAAAAFFARAEKLVDDAQENPPGGPPTAVV